MHPDVNAHQDESSCSISHTAGSISPVESSEIEKKDTFHTKCTPGEDLEAARCQPTPQNSQNGEKQTQDLMLVTWAGPDDPDNPKNWSTKKKWTATVLVSCFTFISPVSSTLVAPALENIANDFNITDQVVSELTLSIFVLAYALGPLVIGPLSEIYGRKMVLQVTNLFYIIFNTACGVSRSTGQMIAFRFLAGIGGSAPMAIGGAVLGDCFRPEERGKAVSIYSLAPLLGPAVGPIAGAFVAERTTWRWVFYATSIAAGVIQIAGFIFLPESHAPKILGERARRIRKETGDAAYQTEAERQRQNRGAVLRAALVRPLRLLTTQPIVQVLALYMGFIYGTMYLTMATFPTLWTSPEYYNESQGIGGLNYISMGLGFILGAQICAILIDRIYRRMKHRNNNVGQPEFRVPILGVAAFCMPVGLFIYGWTAQTHQHWIAPNIGIFIFGMGCIVGMQCIQTYIVDAYTRYAASTLAAAVLLRSLAGFSFPLFAPYMFQALSYGWGNSVLAFIAIGIGIPAPVLLWHFGSGLRRASPFAAGG